MSGSLTDFVFSLVTQKCTCWTSLMIILAPPKAYFPMPSEKWYSWFVILVYDRFQLMHCRILCFYFEWDNLSLFHLFHLVHTMCQKHDNECFPLRRTIDLASTNLNIRYWMGSNYPERIVIWDSLGHEHSMAYHIAVSCYEMQYICQYIIITLRILHEL